MPNMTWGNAGSASVGDSDRLGLAVAGGAVIAAAAVPAAAVPAAAGVALLASRGRAHGRSTGAAALHSARQRPPAAGRPAPAERHCSQGQRPCVCLLLVVVKL